MPIKNNGHWSVLLRRTTLRYPYYQCITRLAELGDFRRIKHYARQPFFGGEAMALVIYNNKIMF